MAANARAIPRPIPTIPHPIPACRRRADRGRPQFDRPRRGLPRVRYDQSGQSQFLRSVRGGVVVRLPRLQKRVPSDETFCGVCGYLIGEELSKYAARIRRLIARAEELSGQGKPWEADACLRQIPRGHLAWYEHAQFVRKIEQLEAALKPLLERRKERIEGVLAKAAELAQTGDFDGSINVLEKASPRFSYARGAGRTGTLPAEPRTTCATGAGVAYAHSKEGPTPNLANDPRSVGFEIQPLGGARCRYETSTDCEKMAEKYVANNRFTEAVQLLEMFPEAIYDADLSAQKTKAITLQALVGLVRSAHYVYPYLPSMMENLSGLLPPNHAPIFSAEELANFRAPLESPRVWSRRIREGKTSALGSPVEWITGFRRIDAAETVDANLLQNGCG